MADLTSFRQVRTTCRYCGREGTGSCVQGQLFLASLPDSLHCESRDCVRKCPTCRDWAHAIGGPDAPDTPAEERAVLKGRLEGPEIEHAVSVGERRHGAARMKGLKHHDAMPTERSAQVMNDIKGAFGEKGCGKTFGMPWATNIGIWTSEDFDLFEVKTSARWREGWFIQAEKGRQLKPLLPYVCVAIERDFLESGEYWLMGWIWGREWLEMPVIQHPSWGPRPDGSRIMVRRVLQDELHPMSSLPEAPRIAHVVDE